jgi:predicted DNA-binding transcriptional regulator AlpA
MSTQRATAEQRYLRTPAAAARLGAAAQTLERWRIEGSGPPFVRLSSKLVTYDVEDLDAWCAARKVTSTSGTR